MSILLQPMAGLDSGNSMTIISWIACLRANDAPAPHDPNLKDWESLNNLKDFFPGLGDEWLDAVRDKSVDDIRDLRDSISNGDISEPPGWELAKGIIDTMKDSEKDTFESQEIRQITKGPKNKANRKYVSCLLRNLNNTTKDAPYCSLPALLIV